MVLKITFRVSVYFFFAVLQLPLCFGLEVQRQEGRLYLKDSSCDEVADVTRTLAEWTVKTGNHKICPINTAKPKVGLFPGNECWFDITDCVPDHVVKYHGVSSKNAGPNCFNLALVLQDILPGLSFSTSEELSFYMRPPLCRQLKNGEKRMPGDVGTIRANDRNTGMLNLHGFIYISEKIIYEKVGLESTMPYRLASLEHTLKSYNLRYKNPKCTQNELDVITFLYPKECAGINNLKGNEPKPPGCDEALRQIILSTENDCYQGTSFFRCTSMAEYLKTHRGTSKKLIDVFEDLNEFDHCLEHHLFKGTALPRTAQKNVLNIAKVLAAYLDQQVQKDKLLGQKDDEETFLIGALQLRLEAISMQLKLSMGFDKMNYQSLDDEISTLTKTIREEVDRLKGYGHRP